MGNSSSNFRVFIALSVLVHLCFILVAKINLLTKKEEPKKPKAVQWVDLDQLPVNIQKKLNQKKRPDRKKQLAHSELLKKSKVAPDNGRLGMQNQFVEKEMQAKKLGMFETSKGKGGADDVQTPDGSSFPAKSKKVSLSKLGLAKINTEPEQKDSPNTKSPREGRENKSSTWFSDVATGDRTLLNTREFVYYGFFLRVQEQFEQHWRSMIQDSVNQIYKAGGRLPSGRDHKTHVKVVLNEQGKLMTVIVQGSSGRMEIDQAAIDAFKKAAQFPHPPKGMIKDGQVDLEWTFILRT
jgi:protein TonB